MNEYNERTLKNVLEDYMEEQDKELLKEIEEAANNPLYQNREGEAEAFAEKYSNAGKKKSKKIFFRVASILLVLVIGLSFIPINVEGQKSSIAELIINYVNSEFLAIDSNETDELLLSYEGKYIPTWIPDRYEVESVTNEKDRKEIVFVNTNGNMITYSELSVELKAKINSEISENVKNINVNGYNGITYEKDEIIYVILTTDNAILYISSDDSEIDLIGFSKKIEKR